MRIFFFFRGFTLNAHIFEVIPAGGFGDWNRLDQVLPYHKVQRNANQDLRGPNRLKKMSQDLILGFFLLFVFYCFCSQYHLVSN